MSQPRSRERRQSSRFDKVFPIYLTSAFGVCRGIARNISEGGIFIETTDPHPLGGRLTVSFTDDDAGVEISVVSEVRYQCVLEYASLQGAPTALRGMGLKFMEFLQTEERLVALEPTAPRSH